MRPSPTKSPAVRSLRQDLGGVEVGCHSTPDTTVRTSPALSRSSRSRSRFMKNLNIISSAPSKLRTMTRVGAFLALVAPGCGAPEPGDVAATESLPLTITTLSTSSKPTQLSLKTNSNLNSGTAAVLWLRYANRSGIYGCYIIGIGDGETK